MDENLSQEQNEKLSIFQEISHMNLEECRNFLVAHSWNLELAVQNTLSDNIENGEQQPMQPQNNRSNNSTNTIITDNQIEIPHRAMAPTSLWQWGYIIISLPIRFIYSTIMDIMSYFWNMLESNERQEIAANYDPLAEVTAFTIEFNENYGAENHPHFYNGPYSQVLDEAKKNLRFLLVYLHKEDSAECKNFARNILSNDEVIRYINANFILWACSHNSNEGKKVTRMLKAKHFPFLGFIILNNSRMTLLAKIEGQLENNDFLDAIRQMKSRFEPELSRLRYDKEQVRQTQILRAEQNREYEESLKQDQERVRKQREVEEQKKKEAENEKMLREEESMRIQRLNDLKNQLKEELALKIEPKAQEANTIKLILKLPNGNRIERFFLKSDPVKDLFNFVFCNDDCPPNFEIVKNFPRKEIACSHSTMTSLEESGIDSSMLLFVNNLDA